MSQIKCHKCKKLLNEFAPVGVDSIKLCDECHRQEIKEAIESRLPKLGDPCANCGTRVSTIEYAGDGGIMAWAHGMWSPWCEICLVTEQLKYARERAAAIPELERKLNALLYPDLNEESKQLPLPYINQDWVPEDDEV